MQVTKAARRYASALLQLADERDEIEAVLGDIHFIKNTIDDSEELVLFLRSPIVKYDDKINALSELFGEHCGELTNQFIQLLARKNRVNLLHQITEAFLKLYNKYAGIIEVDVYTSMDLSDAQKEDLLKSLEKKTDKKVHMRVTKDESLKGGIAVRIDDTVIDGTIKHKLEQLEEQLLRTAIE